MHSTSAPTRLNTELDNTYCIINRNSFFKTFLQYESRVQHVHLQMNFYPEWVPSKRILFFSEWSPFLSISPLPSIQYNSIFQAESFYLNYESPLREVSLLFYYISFSPVPSISLFSRVSPLFSTMSPFSSSTPCFSIASPFSCISNKTILQGEAFGHYQVCPSYLSSTSTITLSLQK